MHRLKLTAFKDTLAPSTLYPHNIRIPHSTSSPLSFYDHLHEEELVFHGYSIMVSLGSLSLCIGQVPDWQISVLWHYFVIFLLRLGGMF